MSYFSDVELLQRQKDARDKLQGKYDEAAKIHAEKQKEVWNVSYTMQVLRYILVKCGYLLDGHYSERRWKP
jgi:hypothetical protein